MLSLLANDSTKPLPTHVLPAMRDNLHVTHYGKGITGQRPSPLVQRNPQDCFRLAACHLQLFPAGLGLFPGATGSPGSAGSRQNHLLVRELPTVDKNPPMQGKACFPFLSLILELPLKRFRNSSLMS